VSLLPLGGGADGVTTHGLQYPLRDEPLTLGSTRGVSNVRTTADAWVSLRGGHLYTIETTEGVSS
jgi:thiamine pyrophosphokinase